MAPLIALKVETLSYLLTPKAFMNPKPDVLTLGANSMHVRTVFVHLYYYFTVFLAYLNNIIESSKCRHQLF